MQKVFYTSLVTFQLCVTMSKVIVYRYRKYQQQYLIVSQLDQGKGEVPECPK